MEENKEKEMPQQTETPTPPSKKDAWKSRYKAKYSPDKEDDIDMESDDYFDNMNKMADDNERMAKNEETMNGIINSNESLKGVIEDAKAGKPFLQSLVERYGIDKLEDAMKDPEVAKALDEANKKYADAKTKQDSNIESAVANINSFAEEKGMSPEDVSKLLEKVNTFADDFFSGNYTPEFLSFIWKGENFDNAVKDAGEQGEIKGRNTAIKAELEKGSEQPNLPPDLGGGGGIPVQPKETKKKTFTNPWTGKEQEYED